MRRAELERRVGAIVVGAAETAWFYARFLLLAAVGLAVVVAIVDAVSR
jgi:hypothetical protein